MQWSKWFIFWNFFYIAKIIISFLESFWSSVFCVFCRLSQYFDISSIPKKLRKRQHITFMMTSSNDDKSNICQFFIRTFSILSIQYTYKISSKIDKNFLRYCMFLNHWPTRLPPTVRFSKKPSPGRVKPVYGSGSVSSLIDFDGAWNIRDNVFQMFFAHKS